MASCVHRLATWVTLLPRLFLDFRENTSSKGWGLSHTYMDTCMPPCMNPLKGLPSPSGMSQIPHKAGLPELKSTESYLLLNPSLHLNSTGILGSHGFWINRSLAAAGYYMWLLNGTCGKGKHKIPRETWRKYIRLRYKGDSQASLSKKAFSLWLALWAILGKSFIWLAMWYQNQKLETPSSDCSYK